MTVQLRIDAQIRETSRMIWGLTVTRSVRLKVDIKKRATMLIY